MEISQLLQMLGRLGAAPRGGVSAPNALQTMMAKKAYNEYEIQTKGDGQQPMPFEMWVQMQSHR